jgi:hypothetical protein
MNLPVGIMASIAEGEGIWFDRLGDIQPVVANVEAVVHHTPTTSKMKFGQSIIDFMLHRVKDCPIEFCPWCARYQLYHHPTKENTFMVRDKESLEVIVARWNLKGKSCGR